MNPPPSIALPYALPVFEPHITLGSVPSSIPVALLQSAIPALSEPLHISFKSLEAGDHFFRSVLVDIVHTPELQQLHAAVQHNLQYALRTDDGAPGELTLGSPRFPHLSLFYIPDAHAADREHIRAAFWEHGDVVARKATSASETEGIAFEIKGAADAKSALPLPPFAGFVASEIWIVSCEGPTEEWKVVVKVPLVR